MFSPKDFLNYKKKLVTNPGFRPPLGIIICYDRKLMEHIEKNHQITKLTREFGAETYLLNEVNSRVAVVGKFGIGSPVAVTLMEELIAFGVKRFISIGTAGTLQKSLKIGDIVVCDRAIRDEGTSHHYLKPSKYSYASNQMVKDIQFALDKSQIKYILGTSWTIDAPYRETVKEARQYQKDGVATVEMEAAALFAVGQYRNVEVGAIFTISDSLAELEWRPKFHSKRTKSGLEILYKTALEALLHH